MKKIYCVIFGNYRKFENPKISSIISSIFEKTIVLLLFAVSVWMKMKKIFKEEESIEILEILDFIKYI